MVAKMLLPQLGGTPAVWNTSMVFYQTVLLLGYLYTHVSHRLLGAKGQAKLHLVVMGISLLFIPLALNMNIGFAAALSPVTWLLLVLAISVGVPFFVLSANAPMVQSWFAHTGHKNSVNPYFLYSASNLGSFIALLGYPFVIEYLIPLSFQAKLWSVIYCVFLVMLCGCMYILYRRFSPAPDGSEEVRENDSGAVPTLYDRLKWILLAFVPSSMLLGVTSYITTDVASIPLLWVIPLSIYLLTFVLVFAKKPIFYKLSVYLCPLFILITAVSMLFASKVSFVSICLIHIAAFFMVTMVYHGRLAKTKPGVQYLTEFFLLISVGGVLGGIFNALIAPVIFDSVAEYPLIIILAALLRPGRDLSIKRSLYLDIALLAAFLLLPIGYPALTEIIGDDAKDVLAIYFMIAVLLSLVSLKRPTRLAVGITALMLMATVLSASSSTRLHIERSFFGVTKVVYDDETNSNWIVHNTTIHGIQSLEPEMKLAPISYYKPLGEIFTALGEDVADKPVGVVGLGSGTAACYCQEGQPIDFYEIDTLVARVASDAQYFTYLRDCPAVSRIILGDGRLMLEKAEDGKYGLLIMDAYSSDALPMHLLTKEALKIYFDKLAEGGLIAFNISNRHLDISHVLAALAEDEGVFLMEKINEAKHELERPSHWIVMARKRCDFNVLQTGRNGWRKVNGNNSSLWTDDYSNILEVLK